MADAIPAASADLLAAQAKSGLDGVAAYKQAQDTLTQQKQSAVQQAMQEAALRGAPVGSMESQQGIVSAPYDQRLASLAQGQGSFEASMAARDQRYSAYQDAVNSARTLIPGEVEKIVAPIRAQGQATIANTTRQGEMAVSEIDANTRLALAKMQAAAAAAAAKSGGGSGGGAGGGRALSGTALQAMLSQGVAAKMQGSLGNLSDLIATNEAASDKRFREVVGTDESKWGADAPEAKANAVARSAEITQGQRNRMENVNEGFNGVVSSTSKTPVKPVPPTRRAGEPPEGYQARLDQYKQQLADYQMAVRQSSIQGSDMSAATAAKAAAAQVAAVAKQRQADSMKPLLANQATANRALTQKSLAEWQSTFGSIGNDQLKFIAGSDPYLAGLITNSPAPITSRNFGQYLAGTPDELGQVDPYSLQAVKAAQDMTVSDLVNQGYKIDPEDYANALGNDMKAGESFAQYQARVNGQLSPQDLAKAVAAQQTAQREDVKYQAWLEDRQHDKAIEQMTDDQKYREYQKTVNTYDPETGQPYTDDNGIPVNATDTQRNTAYDQMATQWILSNGLQLPTSSQYGGPANVMSVIQGNGDGGEFINAYTSIANAYPSGVGLTTEQWTQAAKQLRDQGSTLSNTQLNLLKELLWNKSLDVKKS